jgi:hypothetical protein
MRKTLATIFMACLMASLALADTLYLRNGSVIKGTFIGYENGKFIFQLDNGSRGEWTPQQVLKLELARDTGGGTVGGGTGNPAWRTYPDLDVRLEDQWIRSNIDVHRGQRIRVEASGNIALEGRTNTGPDGLRTRADPYAPEPNEADGVLLAAIGQDASSPSIVVGRSKEFVADRDGMLYYTVNHGETRNARGSFKVRTQVDQSGSYPVSGGGTTGGNTGGQTTGQERTITVSATEAWTDTGIDVTPNMHFEITAEGSIEIGGNYRGVGPDGEARARVATSRYPTQDGVGALIAKIRYRNGGDSNILFVGRQGGGTTEQNEYGRLMLGINDDYFRDNRGSFRVTIRW